MPEDQKHVEPRRQGLARTKGPNATKVVGLVPKLRVIVLVFWVVKTGLIWLGPRRVVFVDQIIISALATVIAAAGLVALHFVKRQAIREHRNATGCCVQCGYDLKATPARCPECGTVSNPPLATVSD